MSRVGSRPKIVDSERRAILEKDMTVLFPDDGTGNEARANFVALFKSADLRAVDFARYANVFKNLFEKAILDESPDQLNALLALFDKSMENLARKTTESLLPFKTEIIGLCQSWMSKHMDNQQPFTNYGITLLVGAILSEEPVDGKLPDDNSEQTFIEFTLNAVKNGRVDHILEGLGAFLRRPLYRERFAQSLATDLSGTDMDAMRRFFSFMESLASTPDGAATFSDLSIVSCLSEKLKKLTNDQTDVLCRIADLIYKLAPGVVFIENAEETDLPATLLQRRGSATDEGLCKCLDKASEALKKRREEMDRDLYTIEAELNAWESELERQEKRLMFVEDQLSKFEKTRKDRHERFPQYKKQIEEFEELIKDYNLKDLRGRLMLVQEQLSRPTKTGMTEAEVQKVLDEFRAKVNEFDGVDPKKYKELRKEITNFARENGFAGMWMEQPEGHVEETVLDDVDEMVEAAVGTAHKQRDIFENFTKFTQGLKGKGFATIGAYIDHLKKEVEKHLPKSAESHDGSGIRKSITGSGRGDGCLGRIGPSLTGSGRGNMNQGRIRPALTRSGTSTRK